MPILETIGIDLPQHNTLLGLAITGSALAAGAFWLLHKHKNQPQPPPLPAEDSDNPVPQPSKRWPEPTLPVLSFPDLLSQTQTQTLIRLAKQDCGLNDATWDGFIMPVIQNVAELVQQLPASESHHHAQPGGLWIHTAETMRHAVRLRQGVVLPSGRDAEDQSKHRHRWTAGVIIGALLHDVGKTVTDLNVRLYGENHRGSPWNAMAGDMRTSRASDYAVGFPKSSERDYKAHQRNGVLLMQRLVPGPTMVWISEDPPLLNALIQYLAGDASGTENQIASIVSEAEKESVKQNLLDGPRTRFATAKVIPLIERLMEAMRRMLSEGGSLPLNRPGAAGYVFEGDIWFAAARLANSVREYLCTHESSIGIPGEDKNDRLFDAWQDYGACRTNPATGRALWGGRVEFDGVASAGYDLPSMLRFPLDRLYPDKTQYPANLEGKLLPIETKAEQAEFAAQQLQQQQPAQPVATATPPATELQPTSSATTDTQTNLPVVNALVSAPVQAPPPLFISPEPISGSAAHAQQADQPFLPPQQQTAHTSTIAAQPAVAVSEFLDECDSATRADLAPQKPPAIVPQTVDVLRPVAPSVTIPAIPGKRVKVSEGGGPSKDAVEFMAWVQQGVSSGSMVYNMPTALVHFARYKDETCMLLVSPMIFRKYAEERGLGNDASLTIQRAFAGAEWHIRAANGKNVVSYQIMRRGERGGNLLNGFLVKQPERFFNPVPPANDRLIFWNTGLK